MGNKVILKVSLNTATIPKTPYNQVPRKTFQMDSDKVHQSIMEYLATIKHPTQRAIVVTEETGGKVSSVDVETALLGWFRKIY